MKVDLRASQWVGIVLVLLFAVAFSVVLPRYADSTTSANGAVTEVAEGTRVSEGSVSVVPSDGWSQSAGLPGTLILNRADSSFLLFAPVDATQSPSDAVAATGKTIASTDGMTVDLGDPTPFTTTSGLEGAKLLVADPNSTTVLFAVTDGKQTVTGQLSTTTSSFSALSKEVDPMLESVDVAGSAAASPSGGSA